MPILKTGPVERAGLWHSDLDPMGVLLRRTRQRKSRAQDLVDISAASACVNRRLQRTGRRHSTYWCYFTSQLPRLCPGPEGEEVLLPLQQQPGPVEPQQDAAPEGQVLEVLDVVKGAPAPLWVAAGDRRAFGQDEMRPKEPIHSPWVPPLLLRRRSQERPTVKLQKDAGGQQGGRACIYRGGNGRLGAGGPSGLVQQLYKAA